MLILKFPKYKRFLKFSLVGLSNTLVDYVMFAFLVKSQHIDIIMANFISFATAFINSFLLNNLWTFSTFDTTKFTTRRFLIFLMGNIGYLTISTLIIFIASMGLSTIYAKGVAVLICFPANYLYYKKYLYKREVFKHVRT